MNFDRIYKTAIMSGKKYYGFDGGDLLDFAGDIALEVMSKKSYRGKASTIVKFCASNLQKRRKDEFVELIDNIEFNQKSAITCPYLIRFLMLEMKCLSDNEYTAVYLRFIENCDLSYIKELGLYVCLKKGLSKLRKNLKTAR